MTETLPEILSREIALHAPDMDATVNASATAAAVASGAFVLRDGKLAPGAPQAIAQCRHFLPPALVQAVAQSAADLVVGPHAKTLAYVQGLGATSWDAALGLDAARIAPEILAEVARDVGSREATWERNAAIMGITADDLKGAL